MVSNVVPTYFQIYITQKTPILMQHWRQNWCQTEFGTFHFALKSYKNKEKPRLLPWFFVIPGAAGLWPKGVVAFECWRWVRCRSRTGKCCID